MPPGRIDTITAHREQGGRVAAVYPVRAPRALLRAHGMLPVEVWGPPRADVTRGGVALQSYLCSVVRCGLAWLLQPWGTPSPGQLGSALSRLWQDQRATSLAMLCGLEASAWLHLIQDGDPMPRLPRLLRRQRRKPHRRTRRRR